MVPEIGRTVGNPPQPVPLQGGPHHQNLTTIRRIAQYAHRSVPASFVILLVLLTENLEVHGVTLAFRRGTDPRARSPPKKESASDGTYTPTLCNSGRRVPILPDPEFRISCLRHLDTHVYEVQQLPEGFRLRE